jgi:hypothetical protein
MFKSTISWLSILATKRLRRRGENGRRSTRGRRRARRSTRGRRRARRSTRRRDITNNAFLITMTWDSYFSTSASICHYLYKKGK